MSSINLTFLGHSAWRINAGEHSILIDPYISGQPNAPVTVDELSPTHIVLSHGHYDHLGDTVPIAKRTGAQVIAVFELANYLRSQGLENVWEMASGGSHSFDFGRLTFTVAHHGSATNDGIDLGPACGIVLALDGATIYHAGDTALFSDMKLIGDRQQLDLALLPIGDNYTMGIDDAVTAVEFLHPKLVIPMHYNTWPPIAVDAEEFRAKVEAKGVGCVVLTPGSQYELTTNGAG